MQKIIVLFCIVCLSFVLSLPYHSCWAGECDYLKENIKKERNFLKRRALFRQALAICRDDALLHYQFGYELERSRKYEEALQFYQQDIALEPTMPKAYFNMGDIYRSQGKTTEAIACYHKGLLLEPDNSRMQKKLEEVLGTSPP